MGATSQSEGFGKIRGSLLKQQRPHLVNLIGELYRLSRENRRFLEARLGEADKQLPLYRQLVTDCLFPDADSYRERGRGPTPIPATTALGTRS